VTKKERSCGRRVGGATEKKSSMYSMELLLFSDRLYEICLCTFADQNLAAHIHKCSRHRIPLTTNPIIQETRAHSKLDQHLQSFVLGCCTKGTVRCLHIFESKLYTSKVSSFPSTFGIKWSSQLTVSNQF
jgi:hypothetical protein